MSNKRKSALKEALEMFQKYQLEVSMNKKQPFFNNTGNNPIQWLGKVLQDTKKRGLLQGLQDLSNPILMNPYIEPIAEPIVGKLRVANYRLRKSALREALEMVKRNPRLALNIPVELLQMLNNIFDIRPRLTQKQQDALTLEAIRSNVLDQVPYTNQATQYLKQLPLESYGRSIMPSMRRDMTTAQYAPMGFTSKQERPTVGINMRELNPKFVAKSFMHEALHALDRNDNPRLPLMSANSFGFFPKLQQAQPQAAGRMSEGPLSSPIYNNSPRTMDAESFAYYGAAGPKVLLGPMQKEYKDVYIPMSKNINYSPRFPINRGGVR